MRRRSHLVGMQYRSIFFQGGFLAGIEIVSAYRFG